MPATAEQYLAQRERWLQIMKSGTAHDFAVEEMRRHLEQGWGIEGLVAVHGSGSGPDGYWYEWRHGHFTITRWRHEACNERYKVSKLVAEAESLIRGEPQQASLWTEPAPEEDPAPIAAGDRVRIIEHAWPAYAAPYRALVGAAVSATSARATKVRRWLVDYGATPQGGRYQVREEHLERVTRDTMATTYEERLV